MQPEQTTSTSNAELLRFNAGTSLGFSLITPAKMDFVFYADHLDVIKKDNVFLTINYSDIKEVTILKTWQFNVLINSSVKIFNIYKIPEETCNRIKEITGK